MVAVICPLMTLIGCNPSSKAGRIKAGINLPAMSAELKRKCIDPGVRAGKDIRIEFARNRQALANCRHKHRDTVIFYDKVRKEYML